LATIVVEKDESCHFQPVGELVFSFFHFAGIEAKKKNT
jgi:hypothetical protein